MAAAVSGRNEVRMRDAGSASTLPPPDLGMPMPAQRRTEAPPVSPAAQDAGRDGWLSDLLSRTDAGGRETPRGRQQGAANPLESLSLDIGRLMDRNLAA